MENVKAAIEWLKRAGYRATQVSNHTIVVIDPVHCSSGSRKWSEDREHPINVANGLDRVAHFICERK